MGWGKTVAHAVAHMCRSGYVLYGDPFLLPTLYGLWISSLVYQTHPFSPESYILGLSVYSHCTSYNMSFFQLYHIHVWSPIMAVAFMVKYSTVLWCSPTDKLSYLLNIYIISWPWLVLTTQWTSLVYSFYLFYFIFLKLIPRFLEEKVNFICLLVEYFVCKVEFNCLKIISIFLSVCVHVWETQRESHSVLVWRSEASLKELVLSTYHVASGIKLRFFRPANKHPYFLGHLTGPLNLVFNWDTVEHFCSSFHGI